MQDIAFDPTAQRTGKNEDQMRILRKFRIPGILQFPEKRRIFRSQPVDFIQNEQMPAGSGSIGNAPQQRIPIIGSRRRDAELAIDLLREVFAFLPGGQARGGWETLKTQSAVTR